MRSNSILLFIFPFIININYSFCLWRNSKDTLETYVIDILFTNSLTIIRCNPYESHVLRDITIETIGHIKCSNRNLFLPDNHIEYITLLQWDHTAITCNKKKKAITEEKTYLDIKHRAKNAFKKIKLELIRVGSTGPSELHLNEKKSQISFKHPPRKLAIINTEQKEGNISTEIYSFKNRPILCRERQVLSEGLCSNVHLNLSYVCYYKVGVAEPPTIAEMEDELKALPDEITSDEDSKVDLYIGKRSKQKSSWSLLSIIGIFGIMFIIISIIVGISIYFCCCRSQEDEQNEDIIRTNSNTSIASNIS